MSRVGVGSDRDEDQLLEAFELAEGTVLWYASPCEVWCNDAWRPATFVATPMKVGVLTHDDLLLGLAPSADFRSDAPPRVVDFEMPPLSRDDDPMQLWIPCADAASVKAVLPCPESAAAQPGIAVRKFPMCEMNPKRVARLISFLWDHAKDSPPASHHRKVQDALKLGDAPTPLHQLAALPRSTAREVVGALMFPRSTEQLATLPTEPRISTLLARRSAAPPDTVLGRFAATLRTTGEIPCSGLSFPRGTAVEVLVTLHRIVVLMGPSDTAPTAPALPGDFIVAVSYAEAPFISQVGVNLCIVVEPPRPKEGAEGTMLYLRTSEDAQEFYYQICMERWLMACMTDADMRREELIRDCVAHNEGASMLLKAENALFPRDDAQDDARAKLIGAQRLLQHFTSLQTKGYVSDEVLASALTCFVSSDSFAKAFLRAPGTGHDRVSYVEFLTGMLVVLDGRKAGRLLLLASLFDGDRVGALSKRRWAEMLKLLHRLEGTGREGWSASNAEDLWAAVAKGNGELMAFHEFAAALADKSQRKVLATFKRLLRPKCYMTSPALRNKAQRIDLGDRSWLFSFDLFEGMATALRHSAGKDERGNSAAAQSRAPGDQRTLFVKSSGAFHYSRCAAEASPGGGTPDENRACALYDYEPKIFAKLRANAKIPLHAFLESLGLNHLLVNMLIGSPTAPRQHSVNLDYHRVLFTSHDSKYYVKSVPESMFRHFLARLPAYAAHLAKHPDSLLPRYLGMFRLTARDMNIEKGMFLVVMARPMTPLREVLSLYEIRGTFSEPQERFSDARGRERVLLKDDDVKGYIDLEYDWYEKVTVQLEADLAFLADCGYLNYAVWVGLNTVASERAENEHVYFEDFHRAWEAEKGKLLFGRFRISCGWCCNCCRTKVAVLSKNSGPSSKKPKTRDPSFPVSPSVAHQASTVGTGWFGMRKLAQYRSTETLASCIVPDPDHDNTANASSNALQSFHGGLPLAERGEVMHVAISDIFSSRISKLHMKDTEAGASVESVGDDASTPRAKKESKVTPKQYSVRLMAWLGAIFRRTTEAVHVDLDDAMGQNVHKFDARLLTRDEVRLVVDPIESRLYLLHGEGGAGGADDGKATEPRTRVVCAPYTLRTPLFSFEKPVSKCSDAKRSLILRGGPVETPRRGGPPSLRTLAFLNERTVQFRSLHDREQFCSLCTLVLLKTQPPRRPSIGDGVLRSRGTLGSVATPLTPHDIPTPVLPESISHTPLSSPSPTMMKIELTGVKLPVYVGTWNLGNRPPGNGQEFSPHDMNPWLGVARDCGVVAVASQECDYRPRAGFDTCSEDWYLSVQASLNEGLDPESRFAIVSCLSMWQIRLIVFVKMNQAHCISDVMNFHEATGVAHIAGNKGGVAVGLKYLESPILFISSHLAAHQGYILRRHSDINEIIHGISHCMGTPYYQVTTDYHHIFWAGDLNYRIDTQSDCEEMYDQSIRSSITIKDRHEVLRHIRAQNWAKLQHEDQMIKSMSGQLGPRLLPQFVEAALPNFPPTFKMFSAYSATVPSDVDLTRDYQGFQHGGSKRVPSWTDRILRSRVFSHSNERAVRTVTYNSCETVVTSDHKPVSAKFVLKARTQYPVWKGLVSTPHSPQEKKRQPVVQLRSISVSHGEALCAEGYPSLCVYTTFCSDPVRTRALNDNTYKWREVVTLVPEFGDEAYLQSEYLYLAIYRGARDYGILGQGVICLENYVGTRQSDIRIEVPIFVEGRCEGYLRGFISVLEVDTLDRPVTTGTSTKSLVPRSDRAGGDEGSSDGSQENATPRAARDREPATPQGFLRQRSFSVVNCTGMMASCSYGYSTPAKNPSPM
eukprot:TRINITY_DN13400_c0_g1_i1.p1 TRINITY_DN13400_c0_g1~~TRINITY_DN13400_c0_g1_i1.p1  ORF type:complete len:1828 (+),score=525.60 TRINITY_DN13400_c0_g1_i1:76-5559(+)